jgi:hypothetical protein
MKLQEEETVPEFEHGYTKYNMSHSTYGTTVWLLQVVKNNAALTQCFENNAYDFMKLHCDLKIRTNNTVID